MEIISLFVVLSILACVIFIGMATVRLIQAEDQPSHGQKVTQHFDAPRNGSIYSERRRGKVPQLQPLKQKS
ncbi:MAG: hypothetical protein RLZ25_1185 [Pseudomonadota bacterium]|jgi:hypothetical protein